MPHNVVAQQQNLLHFITELEPQASFLMSARLMIRFIYSLCWTAIIILASQKHRMLADVCPTD